MSQAAESHAFWRNAFDALMAGEVFAARDATATDNTDSDVSHIFSFVNASALLRLLENNLRSLF